ncbi:hypothetical protein HGRIS_007103 [Hohenbuehelia grisea]|uniref:Extracellular serine-rich protein n=1 Tax=Hohenbuehelia grisea TaxID=104357 RepID=A0ABR3JB62_9AGAR
MSHNMLEALRWSRMHWLLGVCSWLAAIPFVTCENFITVHVGLEGSFFNPSQIAASAGDVITFTFEGDFHDVTQASFDKPCQPLPGGFGSGISGRGPNLTGVAPTWDLRITNASQPIWFYCGASRPLPHCTTGMVGVINSPSNQMYLDYVKASKLVNTTIIPPPPTALSGIGAVATATPQATGTSVTPPGTLSTISAASSSTAITTTAPSTSQNSPSVVSTSSFPKGAIIGVAVGGAIVVLILFLLIYLVIRARRARIIAVTPFHPHDGNQFDGGVHQRSVSDPKLRQISSIPVLAPDLVSVSPMPASDTSTTEPSRSDIIDNGTAPRRVRPLPVAPSPLVRRPSSHSVIPSEKDAGVNIDVLAREVAAILQSSPGTSSQGPLATASESTPGKWQRYREVGDRSPESTPAPPPHYRLQ